MAYNEELAFAKHYYRINAYGIIEMAEDTPADIEEKFWIEWPKFHKKVIERQNRGQFSSKYSILPEEDPEENKKRYRGVE